MKKAIYDTAYARSSVSDVPSEIGPSPANEEQMDDLVLFDTPFLIDYSAAQAWFCWFRLDNMQLVHSYTDMAETADRSVL